MLGFFHFSSSPFLSLSLPSFLICTSYCPVNRWNINARLTLVANLLFNKPMLPSWANCVLSMFTMRAILQHWKYTLLLRAFFVFSLSSRYEFVYNIHRICKSVFTNRKLNASFHLWLRFVTNLETTLLNSRSFTSLAQVFPAGSFYLPDFYTIYFYLGALKPPGTASAAYFRSIKSKERARKIKILALAVRYKGRHTCDKSCRFNCRIERELWFSNFVYNIYIDLSANEISRWLRLLLTSNFFLRTFFFSFYQFFSVNDIWVFSRVWMKYESVLINLSNVFESINYMLNFTVWFYFIFTCTICITLQFYFYFTM